MEDLNRINDIKTIARHYGVRSQLGICQEECAELIQAISKYERTCSNASRMAVAMEIADVLIMVRQTAYLMDIDDQILDAYISAKIDRQLQRIEKET